MSQEDIEQAKHHCKCINALWVPLKLSITPKMHVMLSHAVEFLSYIQGFGDLGEDAGKQAHQQEQHNKLRVSGVKGIVKKENCKLQFELMYNSAKVQLK